MPEYLLPIKNRAHIQSLALTDANDPNSFVIAPTLATGDVQIRTDAGALANIATLPTVTAGSPIIDVNYSATEMDGDRVMLVIIDQSTPKVFADFMYPLYPVPNNIGDLALEATLTDIKGAGFDTLTDSLQAIRARGDTAWATILEATIRSAIGLAAANMDTQIFNLSNSINNVSSRIGTAVDLGEGAPENVVQMLLAMAGKTDNAASFDRTTDSLEAIRDNQPSNTDPGEVPHEITVQSGGVDISGVKCWLSNDKAGANRVSANRYTDDDGKVTFLVTEDVTYYLWRDHHSYSFPNPTAVTKSS